MHAKNSSGTKIKGWQRYIMTVESLEFVLCMCLLGLLVVACGRRLPPPAAAAMAGPSAPPESTSPAPRPFSCFPRRPRRHPPPAPALHPLGAVPVPGSRLHATAPVAASPVFIPSDVDISDAGFSSITAPALRLHSTLPSGAGFLPRGAAAAAFFFPTPVCNGPPIILFRFFWTAPSTRSPRCCIGAHIAALTNGVFVYQGPV